MSRIWIDGFDVYFFKSASMVRKGNELLPIIHILSENRCNPQLERSTLFSVLKFDSSFWIWVFCPNDERQSIKSLFGRKMIGRKDRLAEYRLAECNVLPRVRWTECWLIENSIIIKTNWTTAQLAEFLCCLNLALVLYNISLGLEGFGNLSYTPKANACVPMSLARSRGT